MTSTRNGFAVNLLRRMLHVLHELAFAYSANAFIDLWRKWFRLLHAHSWCTWGTSFVSFVHERFCDRNCLSLLAITFKHNNVQKFLFRSESISCCNNTIWTLLTPLFIFFFTFSFLVSCTLLSRTSFFWIFKCLSWYEKFRPGLFVSCIYIYIFSLHFQYFVLP